MTNDASKQSEVYRFVGGADITRADLIRQWETNLSWQRKEAVMMFANLILTGLLKRVDDSVSIIASWEKVLIYVKNNNYELAV